MLYHLLDYFKDFVHRLGFYAWEDVMFRSIAAAILSWLIAFLVGPKIIRWLMRKKVGDRPEFNHVGLNELNKEKANTPTMGGLIILLAVLSATLLLAKLNNPFVQKAIILVITSDNGGKTWSESKRLPDGIIGPIKNKPILLTNGTLLSPTSTEHDGWKIQVEQSNDLGKTWTTSSDLNDGKVIGAIQPTILTYGNDRIQLLSRTENGFISECWSENNGKTWSEMTQMTLPNPNSGIDAVTLKDGRQVLIYNPTGGDWGDRVPLSVAISRDGKKWQQLFDLESAPYQ